MTLLEKSSRQAQKRLWLNRWLSALGWSLTGAAGVFFVLVILQRILLSTMEAGLFFGIAAIALTVLALISSIVWSLWTRESLPAAAACLDKAARLKERLSSALHCRTIDDPFAQAVVADAEQVSKKVVVPLYLPIRAPRSANYAGLSLVLALLVLWLFPTVDLAGKNEEALQKKDMADQVARVKADIQPRVQQQMNKLAEQNPTLKKDIDDLEAMREAPLQTPFDVRREEMKKLESLKEKWESRRDSSELAKVQEFKNMARRLAATRQQSKTPVGDLNKALSEGDLKAAQAAIETLKEELAKAAKTPEEKQKAEEMQQQLEAVAKKLEQMAKDDKKVQDAMAKAGLSKEDIAKALENIKKGDKEALKQQLKDKGLSESQAQELAQLADKRCGACDLANKLGMSLGQAAAAMGQGADQAGNKALDGLTAAGEQLSQLEAMEQELNQLAQGLSELDAMKNNLGQGCSQCNGTGMCNGQPCGMCNGSGMCNGQGQGGKGMGMGGLGRGQGNIAPKEATNVGLKYERTPVHTGPGRIISQQWVDGEQFKSEPTGEFVEANIAAQRATADAIEREQIPRQYHGPLREYFKHSAEGLPVDQTPSANPGTEASK